MGQFNDLEKKKVQSSDEDVKTIHEMISEALMGTSPPSNIDSQYQGVNFGPNDLTDNEAQLLYNAITNNENESGLTLGKLYLQFQNLDSRLTRVEEVIAKQGVVGCNTGRKRVPTMFRSGEYPGSNDFCFGIGHNSDVINTSGSGLTTINPILTSSNDIMNMDTFQDSSSAYSLHSVRSASNNPRIQRKDEIKRSELDHICLPLLEHDPKPTTEQLQEIVNSISSIYPKISSKHLLSKVREWFRKKREYMSQRIFLVCGQVFNNVRIESEAELEYQIHEMDSNTIIIDNVVKHADLEIIDPVVARDYCREKILSYLNGLYKPTSLKNRAL